MVAWGRRLASPAVVLTAMALAAVGCERSERGTVAALELDGSSVIAEQRCREKGDTYDYVRCGKELRASVKRRLCAERGRGRHVYLYRTGESSPIETAVECQ